MNAARWGVLSRWCAVVLALALAACARGDDAAVQPSVSAAHEPLHAWVIVPKADRKESVIFHVPPRTGRVGAKLGVAYIAARLMGSPARVAAWGTRAYLVTDPESVGASRHRRVYTVNARYEGAWGWSYQPENRLGVLPSLPAEGELAALVADPGGVSALLWTPGTDEAPAAWQAWRLEGVGTSEWTPLALPWDEPGAERPLRGSATLVTLGARTTAVAVRPRGTGGAALEAWGYDGGAWTRTIDASSTPLTWMPNVEALIGLDGRIVEVAAGGPGVVVHSVWPLARRAIGEASTLPDDPAGALGVGVLDRGVVVAMWRGTAAKGDRVVETPPPGAPGGSLVPARADAARYKIAEISTRTGRVLGSGTVRQPTPLADRPLHMVALMTAGFMSALLIYTLRRGDPKALPAPFVPGSLLRRAIATGTDLALGLALAGGMWRTAPMELLTVQTLLGSVTDAAPIWTALALAAIHSTVGEMTVGGSIGKVAMGCRVGVVAAVEGEAPRIRRAPWPSVVVRNLIKWSVLPALVLAVVDPLRRHAADVVAGTVVVDLPASPSSPEQGGGG